MLTNKIYSGILRLIKTVLCLILIGGATDAGAQQVDSLPAYLREAAGNNPGLKASYSRYLAALEKIPQAGALPDPEAQFSFFITPMELMEGSQLADFRLMQMAPWFGTLTAAKDEASKMALANYQEMQSVKNDLFLQVRSSWYQLFRTEQEIGSAEKNLVLLQTLERMALIRFKTSGTAGSATAGGSAAMESPRKSDNSAAGGGSMGSMAAGSQVKTTGMQDAPPAGMGSSNQGGMVNLLKVQIEIGSLENRLALLRDQLKTEKTRFNTYLNREPDTRVFMTDSLTEPTLPGPLAQLTDSIVNNPMVKMYEADKAANEAQIIMATKMGYPMVGIGINYSLIRKSPELTSKMNGQDMIMPMVTATLPIYRKKYNALRREAGYLRDAAAESVVNVRNELGVKFQQAVQQYDDAGRRIELYKRQASLAEKTVSLLTRSFSSAGTEYEEILQMQRQWLDYEFNHIEALVDRCTAAATVLSIIHSN